MKDDLAYIHHMLDAVRRIVEYTQGGREAFFCDARTQDAVVRNLEVLGEAAKNLTESTRATQTEVPWKQIAGMRDKLIHEYFGVNLVLVWDVIEQELPVLQKKLEAILTLRQPPP